MWTYLGTAGRLTVTTKEASQPGPRHFFPPVADEDRLEPCGSHLRRSDGPAIAAAVSLRHPFTIRRYELRLYFADSLRQRM